MAACSGLRMAAWAVATATTVFMALGALDVAGAFTDPHRVRPARRGRVSHAGDGRPADRAPPAAQQDRVDHCWSGRSCRRSSSRSRFSLDEGWALQIDRALWPLLYAWPIAVAFVFPNGRLLSPEVAVGRHRRGGLASSAFDRGRHASTPSRSTATTPTSRTRWRATPSRDWLEEHLEWLSVLLARRCSAASSPARSRSGSDSGARAGSSGCRRSGSPGRRCSSRSRSLVCFASGFLGVRSASRSSTRSCSRCCSGSTIAVAVVGRDRRGALPAVRDRAARQPHARLRDADDAARRRVRRADARARRARRQRLGLGHGRRRRSSWPSRSSRSGRASRSSSTGASAGRATRACAACGRSRTRCATDAGRRRRSAAVLARGARRPARRASLLAARDRGVRGRGGRARPTYPTTIAREPRSTRDGVRDGRAAPRLGAPRAADLLRRRPARSRALGRDGAPPRRGPPPARRGRGVARPDRRGGLRGATPSRARPPRRRAAAARLARRPGAPAAASAPARGGGALARARPRRRRDRGGDRRPAPDRRRRAAGAARRRPLGRAGRPRAHGADPGRRRRAARARPGERRGGGLLRRLRGAHERGQATRPRRVCPMRAVRENGHAARLVTDDGIGGAVVRRGSGLAGLQDRVAAHGGTLEVVEPARPRAHASRWRSRATRDRRRHGAAPRGARGLLEDAGHTVVARVGDAEALLVRRRRARAGPRDRRRADAADLRGRGHARGGRDPPATPGDGRPRALAARRVEPRGRARRLGRRLRLPAEGSRARRRRVPRGGRARERRRQRARPGGRQAAPRPTGRRRHARRS